MNLYIYSTLCVPKKDAEVPRVRGRAQRIYTYPSTKEGESESVRAQTRIPGYEEIVGTKVYHNHYSKNDSDIQELVLEYSSCQRCKLGLYRGCVVHGRGFGPVRIVFVGQAPGDEENESGLAFVGDAGKMWNTVVRKAKFKTPHVLTNMVACRPQDGPGSCKRDEPLMEEVIACSSRLWRFLLAYRPSAVISLGRFPTKMFWEDSAKFTRNVLYERIPNKLYLGYTWHPSFLQRNMSKGGMEAYMSVIEFLVQLDKFMAKVPSIPREEPWTLSPETQYPFPFLRKIDS